MSHRNRLDEAGVWCMCAVPSPGDWDTWSVNLRLSSTTQWERLWLKTNKQARTPNNSNNTPPRPQKQRNQFNDILLVQTKQKLRVSILSTLFSWSNGGPRRWPWNARSFRKNSGTGMVLSYSKTPLSSLQLPNVTHPWDAKLFYLFCVVSGGEVLKYTHDSRKWHQERNSLKGRSLCVLV